MKHVSEEIFGFHSLTPDALEPNLLQLHARQVRQPSFSVGIWLCQTNRFVTQRYRRGIGVRREMVENLHMPFVSMQKSPSIKKVPSLT
jgi:hypothetical protein